MDAAAHDLKKGRAQRVQRREVDHVVERARRQVVGGQCLGAHAPRTRTLRRLWRQLCKVVVEHAQKLRARAPSLRDARLKEAARNLSRVHTQVLLGVDDAHRRAHDTRNGGGEAATRGHDHRDGGIVPAAGQPFGALLLARIDDRRAAHGGVQRATDERHKDPLAPPGRRQTQ